MGIHFPHVVKVSMWHTFAVCHLLIFIQKNIQVKLAFQILEAPERKAFANVPDAETSSSLAVSGNA